MTGRFLFGLILICSACASGDAPSDTYTGRIVLERTQPRAEHLARIPAAASWCASDTTLSIVGTSASWSAAIALRVKWPETTGSIRVDSARAAGRARIAVRQLGDSIAPALVAHGGKVLLTQAGNALAGQFDFTAGADSTATSMSGRFEGIGVVSICP